LLGFSVQFSENMSEEIPDELNPRQRLFVEKLTSGMAAGRAYEAAGYGAKGSSADVQASKLVRNGKVAAAVKAAYRALSDAKRWEKWQMLDYLQNVLETPVGMIDEHNVLAQEVSRDEVGGGAQGQLMRGAEPSGNETVTPDVTRVKVKMFGKKDAAKMFIDLMGWNAPQKVDVNGVGELVQALAKLAPTSVLPEDKM
jgi:phage terminase small subunit